MYNTIFIYINFDVIGFILTSSLLSYKIAKLIITLISL